MKKVRIIQIVLLCTVVLLLAGTMILLLAGHSGFRFLRGVNRMEMSEKAYPMDRVSALQIEYHYENIYLYEGDSDQLVIREYRNSWSRKAGETKAEQSGKTLSIKGVRNRGSFGFFLFNFGSGDYVEVYLPEGQVPEELDVSAGSGNIRAEHGEAKSLILETGSGNIYVDRSNGELTAEAGSGNIRIYDHEGELSAETGSGNIQAVCGSVQGSLNAGSGNVDLTMQELTGDLRMDSGSGNLRLTIPQTESFFFDAVTGSGDIRTFFDDELSFNRRGNNASGEYGSEMSHTIMMNTGSGNVHVSR